MHATRRQQHEAFVSNLEGGPLPEVFAVSAASALLFVLAAGLKRRLPKHPLAVDFIFAVLPNILLVTLGSSHVLLLLLLLLPLLALLLLLPAPSRSLLDERGQPACIGCYRGLMLACTSLCILAVDFPAFPRRFAKAETFGTGLMDVGVGSFALALGLVSREARGLQTRLRAALRSTIAPLLLLGALRTLSVKATGYQEHVTEYGVHWNFFLTLGCSKLLVLLTHRLNAGRVSLLLLAALSSGLQAAQLFLGGATWVLQADRTTLLSANKEGLVSLPAFIAIELWGTWLGSRIHRALRPERQERAAAVRLARWLLGVAVSSALLTASVGPVSRRLGNFAYIAWTVSNAAMTLLIFLGGQLLLKEEPGHPAASQLGSDDFLGMLNRAGLFHFLAANLATGVVNFCLDTIVISDALAVLILTAYQLLLLAAVRAYRGLRR